MGQTNYLKIVWCILYIAFATFSCWATAESLYMTWPEIPYLFCWVVAVGFFLVASVGGWMIAESFNKGKFYKNRNLMFWGGILVMFFFWIVCCLPTNTHTFLYRHIASQIVINDIETTQNYLKQIENNQFNDEKYQKKCEELKNKVDNKLIALKNEIENPLNPGIGQHAKDIMNEFPELLRVEGIAPLSTKTNNLSMQDKIRYYEAYRRMIYNMLPSAFSKIKADVMPPLNAIVEMKDKAQGCYNNLIIVKKAIESGEKDIYDAKDIENPICKKITEGYVTIKDYQQFVNFQTPQDRVTYTSSNAETKVKHIISVYDLWNDFLFGNNIGGLFMFFCLVISILIDSAAFVFFYLLTK